MERNEDKPKRGNKRKVKLMKNQKNKDRLTEKSKNERNEKRLAFLCVCLYKVHFYFLFFPLIPTFLRSFSFFSPFVLPFFTALSCSPLAVFPFILLFACFSLPFTFPSTQLSPLSFSLFPLSLLSLSPFSQHGARNHGNGIVWTSKRRFGC